MLIWDFPQRPQTVKSFERNMFAITNLWVYVSTFGIPIEFLIQAT